MQWTSHLGQNRQSVTVLAGTRFPRVSCPDHLTSSARMRLFIQTTCHSFPSTEAKLHQPSAAEYPLPYHSYAMKAYNPPAAPPATPGSKRRLPPTSFSSTDCSRRVHLHPHPYLGPGVRDTCVVLSRLPNGGGCSRHRRADNRGCRGRDRFEGHGVYVYYLDERCTGDMAGEDVGDVGGVGGVGVAETGLGQ